jgi:hypothetical protein
MAKPGNKPNATVVKANPRQVFKLAPSDMTFLFEDCKRCFYNKVALGVPRPSLPFPGLFTRLDKLEKGFYAQMRTTDVDQSLPPGSFSIGEHWVQSKTHRTPSQKACFFIRGVFDVAIEFDDGTFGISDYKTTSPKDDHVPLYGRQLHSYAFALEYPEQGKLHLAPISKLGLLAIDPVEMIKFNGGGAFRLETTWIEVAKDYKAFKAFLSEVFTVLESGTAPAPDPKCRICEYLEVARREGL